MASAMNSAGPDETHVSLSIAGVDFDVVIRGADPSRVERRFGGYRSPRRPGAVRVDIAVSADEAVRSLPQPTEIEFPGFHVVRDPLDLYRFRRRGGEIVFDRGRNVATCRFCDSNPNLDPEEDSTAVDPATRALLTLLLPQYDGFMLHAAGWADERGAVLFVGPTEAGKTTCARKLAPLGILSDDQVAVRREAGDWYAYATPFVGEYGRPTIPRRAVVRMIYLIEKSPGGAVVHPVSKGEGLVRMMRCVAWNATGDPSIGSAFECVADLVASGRVARLELSRDASLDGVIEAALCRP